MELIDNPCAHSTRYPSERSGVSRGFLLVGCFQARLLDALGFGEEQELGASSLFFLVRCFFWTLLGVFFLCFSLGLLGLPFDLFMLGQNFFALPRFFGVLL